MDLLCPTAFFQAKKVAIIKTKSAAIAFFLYSSFPSPFSFFFSFAFSAVTVEPLGLRNLPFDAFSLKMRANSFTFVFKKSPRRI